MTDSQKDQPTPETNKDDNEGGGNPDSPPNPHITLDRGDAITSHLVHNPSHPRPVNAWKRGICVRQECHSELASNYAFWDSLCNGISVGLAAISSSTVFASASGSGNTKLTWWAGGIAAVSAVLQAILKSLSLATSAEQHRMAASQFTKLRFRLEIITGNNYVDDGELKMDKLAEWVREYEDILEGAPIIPQKQFKKVQGKKKGEVGWKSVKELEEEKKEQLDKLKMELKLKNKEIELIEGAGWISKAKLNKSLDKFKEDEEWKRKEVELSKKVELKSKNQRGIETKEQLDKLKGEDEWNPMSIESSIV